MAELESAVEKRLVDGVAALGGVAYKLAPTVKGMPDRLVVMPGEAPAFVELKAEGGSVSPAQRVIHKRLHLLGQAVYVLAGRREVDRYLEHLRQNKEKR